MAQITGQAGVNLTQELANYLDASGGNLTSEQLSINIFQVVINLVLVVVQSQMVSIKDSESLTK